MSKTATEPTTFRQTSRRTFLQASGVAVGAFRGMSAAVAREGSESAIANAPAKRAIVLFLQGGCSQLDSWDMKPDAPAEYRGEFDSIATATPGYRVCEHMPMLAARTDRFNVLRSVHHGTPSHEAAIHWVLTGYDYPGANVTTKNRNDKPSVGSFVAKVRGSSQPGLPAYFCVRTKGSSATACDMPTRTSWDWPMLRLSPAQFRWMPNRVIESRSHWSCSERCR